MSKLVIEVVIEDGLLHWGIQHTDIHLDGTDIEELHIAIQPLAEQMGCLCEVGDLEQMCRDLGWSGPNEEEL